MYANDCDILILIAIWNFWKSAKKNLNNACLCVCKKESKTQERTQSEAKGSISFWLWNFLYHRNLSTNRWQTLLKSLSFPFLFLIFENFKNFQWITTSQNHFEDTYFFCLNFSYKDPTLWIMRLVLNNNEHGIDNNANWFLREEVLSK